MYCIIRIFCIILLVLCRNTSILDTTSLLSTYLFQLKNLFLCKITTTKTQSIRQYGIKRDFTYRNYDFSGCTFIGAAL